MGTADEPTLRNETEAQTHPPNDNDVEAHATTMIDTVAECSPGKTPDDKEKTTFTATTGIGNEEHHRRQGHRPRVCARRGV